MNILSYRGSGAPGGVSSTLAQAERYSGVNMGDWIHMNQWTISQVSLASPRRRSLLTLPQEVVDGHYRYCNGFVWPLMHDMPQYAQYDASEHRAYTEFNSCFATVSYLSAYDNRAWFVNDYQLALAPKLLKAAGAERSVSFWHIPWPKNVPESAVPFIAQVAEGLLSSSLIGFHTEEYVDNFKRFVRHHLPEHIVPIKGDEIYSRRARSPVSTVQSTVVLAQPLGVDLDLWMERTLQEDDESEAFLEQLTGGKRFVLSVDRADYTKGVIHRLDAIDRFLERNQHLTGEIVFVQVCQQSRAGISQFDNYFEEVRKRAAAINARWEEDGWQPLCWVSTSVTPHTLAKLYRSADVMLINAIRDGLNLTAKEFLACQTANPGALILSKETGVYQELKYGAIGINPLKTEEITDAVERALKMSLKERLFRINSMRRALNDNRLSDWWQLLTHEISASRRYCLDDRRRAV